MNTPDRPRSPFLAPSPPFSNASAVTMVSDYIPSEWEKKTYYHGVSVDPPELLYRSDYLDNPFPRHDMATTPRK